MEREFYEQPTLPHLPIEATESNIPKTIGPYKIESLLSKGGMSLLYLGLSPKNQPLAVKVLSPAFVSHPEMVDQFMKEAKIIALTNHPNIIKLHGQGEWENGLYIAMEFIQGVSLKQFIVQHSLSMKRSLEIILEVAYALLHLHTHGVIHRDLKPENILITEEGKVKVIDFGIAQLTIDQISLPGHRGGTIGTPSYMSPEQKKDPLKVTFASDIFSIGVILYELILGKLSYGSIQLSLLPKKIKPIVEKALQPDLKRRYTDIVDLISDVSNVLKSETYLQDQKGEDEIKELRENLQNSYQTLLPPIPKNWPEADIGLAKQSKFNQFGIFYDFVRLDDRSYLILLMQTNDAGIDDLLKISLFKGMWEKQKHDFASTLKLDVLISEWNELIFSQKSVTPVAINLLHLRPSENLFSFVSSGFDSMLHYSMSQASIRQLINRNPLLGEERGVEFSSVTDRWDEGDILLLHTFHGFVENLSEIEKLDPEIQKLFLEYAHLSVSNGAQHILKKISESFLTLDPKSHAVIAIQKIA